MRFTRRIHRIPAARVNRVWSCGLFMQHFDSARRVREPIRTKPKFLGYTRNIMEDFQPRGSVDQRVSVACRGGGCDAIYLTGAGAAFTEQFL
jgi:hypothetical protein